jgi:hypothetical protein
MTKSGWRNESYRHYLAAKGIATKYKYYSKFGDFLRTTGNELQAGQERYYREEPAKEAARLRMQQAVIAKERETPLDELEQKAMQESLAAAGKSYTESRLKERLETLRDGKNAVIKEREQTYDALNERIAESDMMWSSKIKHALDRGESATTIAKLRHDANSERDSLHAVKYKYDHNTDNETANIKLYDQLIRDALKKQIIVTRTRKIGEKING